MRTIDCDCLADAAPELALGILPGDERADAIAHLDECPSCQQLVGSLTVVTDHLLLAAPPAAPPAGFEERVLAAIAAERSGHQVEVDPPHPTARRRIPGAVLAVAAAIAALFLALGVFRDGSSPSVAAAEMRTGGGDVVGEIVVEDGPPARVFMHLPGWNAPSGRYGEQAGGYSLLLTMAEGPPLVVPVAMSDDSTWGATVDGVDVGGITSAALLDRGGRVWCSATF